MQLLLHTIVLHQTTTLCHTLISLRNCFIPLFYIKPQLLLTSTLRHVDCFIPLFYIKPQQPSARHSALSIASYHCSTSNHNRSTPIILQAAIASYHCSTSNHNIYFVFCLFTGICHITLIHEVVEIDFLLCKYTKKILTAMGLVEISSLWLPICE